MTFTADEALAALRALYATDAYHTDATAYAIKYVECTRIVPEWLETMTARTNKWFVRHNGRTYQTIAASRADAVNNVRYNIYGRIPESQCGAFDAVNPAFVIMDAVGAKRRADDRTAPRDLFGKKVISKADALARIRRMAS